MPTLADAADEDATEAEADAADEDAAEADAVEADAELALSEADALLEELLVQPTTPMASTAAKAIASSFLFM